MDIEVKEHKEVINGNHDDIVVLDDSSSAHAVAAKHDSQTHQKQHFCIQFLNDKFLLALSKMALKKNTTALIIAIQADCIIVQTHSAYSGNNDSATFYKNMFHSYQVYQPIKYVITCDQLKFIHNLFDATKLTMYDFHIDDLKGIEFNMSDDTNEYKFYVYENCKEKLKLLSPYLNQNATTYCIKLGTDTLKERLKYVTASKETQTVQIRVENGYLVFESRNTANVILLQTKYTLDGSPSTIEWSSTLDTNTISHLNGLQSLSSTVIIEFIKMKSKKDVECIILRFTFELTTDEPTSIFTLIIDSNSNKNVY